ncbi:unnamed protein product [Alopecurus aequalis]
MTRLPIAKLCAATDRNKTAAAARLASKPPPSPRLSPSSLLAHPPPSGMAATADPRAKPAAPHHLEPWARQQQQPPRAHRVRVPAHPAVEDRDRRRSSSHSHPRSTGGGEDGGIEDLRAKLMGHLRDAADRLRVVPQPTPPLPPPPAKEPEPEIISAPPAAQVQQQEADVAADKPWKLRERTRRRPAALQSWPTPPSRRRKREPFSVALAREEIEEDIYALTGGRPRRRPRKRPRVVQQKLDSVFPGLWLTEITADDYKVAAEE